MRQQLALPLVFLLWLYAGCDRDKPSSSSSAGDAGAIPDHYGLFAIIDGKAQQLHGGDAPAEFPKTAEFIYFDKRVPTMGSDLHFYVIPRALAGREFPRGAARRSGEFDLHSIPIDAHVKPIAGQAEMIRIVPAEPLDPGLYCLED